MSKAYDASSPSIPPRRTFYRRSLPSTCTSLSSKEGKIYFQSALAGNGLKSFFPLIEQFTTQSEPAYCGISTLVMVLNALAVDPRKTWKGPWRWYEESMLNCCIDLEEVKTTGITLNAFKCLALCQGLLVKSHFASEESLEGFRSAVRKACVESDEHPLNGDPDPFLVVSYSRKVVQQTGSGHFSPVAAYDEASDKVLILDTARFKYGAHWIDLPLLYEAMQPVDPDTGKSRGYFLLSFHEDPSVPTTPISILFRTKQSHATARTHYKDFLQTTKGPVSLEDVLAFFTKDGNDQNSVWKILQAQLTPIDSAGQQAVEDVVLLIQDLISNYPVLPQTERQCHPNMNRTVCLQPHEAIFVLYLASIDAEERKQIVLSSTLADSYSAEQLLAEAELLELAIKMSDRQE